MISYNIFLNEDLKSEEGGIKLRMSTKLKNTFKALANKNATKKISEFFLNNIRSPNFELDISFLNITDKSDTISFISKQRITKLSRNERQQIDAYKSPLRQNMKIGRIIRNISSADFTDQEIELFVNEFKAHMDLLNGNVQLRLVDGEDIRYWYLSTRYATGGGSLNNSCMRSQGNQNQLNVYVDNPKVCKLAILVNSDGLLEARALVWQTNKGTFMDRVYYINDYMQNAFFQYAKKHGWMNRETNRESLTVTLDPTKRYANYPYFDTFRRHNRDTNILTT